MKETQSGMVDRYGRSVVYMLTGGFEHLVKQLGGTLMGYSIRGSEGDVLLVMRVDFEGKRMVGFQGAVTAAGAIHKAERELRENKVKWRDDRFHQKSG